jgi:hypothetical protein
MRGATARIRLGDDGNGKRLIDRRIAARQHALAVRMAAASLRHQGFLSRLAIVPRHSGDGACTRHGSAPQDPFTQDLGKRLMPAAVGRCRRLGASASGPIISDCDYLSRLL